MIPTYPTGELTKDIALGRMGKLDVDQTVEVSMKIKGLINDRIASGLAYVGMVQTIDADATRFVEEFSKES